VYFPTPRKKNIINLMIFSPQYAEEAFFSCFLKKNGGMMDRKCIQEFKKLIPADMPRAEKDRLVSYRDSQVFIWLDFSVLVNHCMCNAEINAGGKP